MFLLACLVAGDLCMVLSQWLAWFFTGAWRVLCSVPDDSLEIFAVPLDLGGYALEVSARGVWKIFVFPSFLSPLTTFRHSWVLSFIFWGITFFIWFHLNIINTFPDIIILRPLRFFRPRLLPWTLGPGRDSSRSR